MSGYACPHWDGGFVNIGSFVCHFTLYGVTKRVTDVTKRVPIRKKRFHVPRPEFAYRPATGTDAGLAVWVIGLCTALGRVRTKILASRFAPDDTPHLKLILPSGKKIGSALMSI